MATGIVSQGLAAVGAPRLSDALSAVAAVLYGGLLAGPVWLAAVLLAGLTATVIPRLPLLHPGPAAAGAGVPLGQEGLSAWVRVVQALK